ncbi:DNA-binding transcriptional MerR regulator [Saccharothrix ecbatanensis]|uniref:DNA-binding transcriptional MerR regulator n=1 Tax=Saccharothrix ecbatanensis TaxID=1105145 RepID=A0A7W9HKQ3_9PSEU|nr:MerR family transcriptional regulator [Saccharothrix ecbatanensis]MBB5804097.1 DNA-binding transcriptional MerR regulator [Saccharothrix ecbatanensis]
MDGAVFTIGELARRTGLTVKAIRFYSDRGLVPPTGRSPTGYRLYGHDAVARLDLVRTLRELGVDLATIRDVLEHRRTLAEVAAAHVDALAAQIGVLRLRRAVLTVVAEGGTGIEEVGLMSRLSEDGRRRLVGEFLDAAFGDLAGDPGFAGMVRSMTPELPEHPADEQVEAWVSLTRLAQDPDFRACLKRLAEQHVLTRGEGLRPDPAAVVLDEVGPALAARVDPASPEARNVIAAVMERVPHVSREQLAALLETANDTRRDRYLRLLAVVNGWQAPESPAPMFEWFLRALGHESTVSTG